MNSCGSPLIYLAALSDFELVPKLSGVQAFSPGLETTLEAAERAIAEGLANGVQRFDCNDPCLGDQTGDGLRHCAFCAGRCRCVVAGYRQGVVKIPSPQSRLVASEPSELHLVPASTLTQ